MCAVISNTQGGKKNAKTRKNLEVSNIALWKPDVNEGKVFGRVVLFRNGATQNN